ncbi:MAG: cupin domain-containing protein [Pseudolabrys sp.]|nr:cupin domain-containing protein [Pseudolabrys sp.]
MLRRTLIAAFAALAIAPALAQSLSPAPSYPAVPLLSTGTTIVGEKIRYPSGDAHVTASIVTLAPGARTIMHKHDVPLFAYILEGELTVDYGTHGKRTYTQGQSLMEAMAVPHFGVNTGDKTMRLIGVYMGADGADDVTPVK